MCVSALILHLKKNANTRQIVVGIDRKIQEVMNENNPFLFFYIFTHFRVLPKVLFGPSGRVYCVASATDVPVTLLCAVLIGNGPEKHFTSIHHFSSCTSREKE